MLSDFYAVIPAGGAGTRLWPLSRAGAPKFLLDLTGAGETLLQATYGRLSQLAEAVLVVTGAKHEQACREQLPNLTDADIFAEPSPRNSMAAIGLAATVLQKRHGDVIVGSFAADHVIHGQSGFDDAVAEAVAVARAGFVATIGIAATRPATGFGYIECGEPLEIAGAPRARHVVAFTEKPDSDTAAQYVNAGNYRWNAGMFVFRTSVLLEHLAKQLPDLAAGLQRIASDWDTPARNDTLRQVWPTLESISIDHAIAEPVAALGGVAVIPANFAWHDIGDFTTLGSLLPAEDDAGNKVLGSGDVINLDTAGNIVIPSSGRLVALLGVDDLVVVDTPDALLITARSRAQMVGKLVDVARELGLDEVV
jgi:mannose-1-phosphate guanylyltransferase